MSIFKILLAGTAFVALSTAANAAECNLGENAKVTMTPKALGTVSAAQPAEIVAVLYPKEAYSSVKAACSQEQVLAAFIRINGPETVGFDKPFKVPVLIAPILQASAASAEKPAMTTVSNPVVQALPAAAVPVVKQLEETRSAIAAKQKERAIATPQRPQSTWTAGERQRLSMLDAEIATLKQQYASFQQQLDDIKKQVDMKADRSYVDQKNAAQDERIKKLELAPSGESFTVFGYQLSLKSVLVALGLMVSIALALALAVWRRKLPAPQPADVNVSLDLSGYAKTEEVAELRQQLEELSTDVSDGAKDRKQIELPTDLVDSLKALAIGESIDVSIGVNGKRGLIGFTKHNDTQVMAHDIDKQTQAMNIDGICKTINRAIGGGRVKMRPIATAAVA